MTGQVKLGGRPATAREGGRGFTAFDYKSDEGNIDADDPLIIGWPNGRWAAAVAKDSYIGGDETEILVHY